MAAAASNAGPTEFSRDRRASTRTQLKNKVVGLGYGSTSRKTFYKRLFGKYDINGDMKLGMQEFIVFLKSQYGHIDEAESKAVLAKIDLDDSGDIDFDEFLEFVGLGGSQEKLGTIKESVVTRSLPIKPLDQLSWCLTQMAERKNLTFTMVCLNKLFSSLTPIQLINAGAMVELWSVIAEYNSIDKDRGKAKQLVGCANAAHKLSISDSMEYHEDDQHGAKVGGQAAKGAGACGITVVQREAAIDLLERLSMELPSNEKKGLKLPDADALVEELHLRTVVFILDHVKKSAGTAKSEAVEDDDSSLTLEDRIAQMRLEMEKTMLEEEVGSAAAAFEHQEDIDHEEVLFLLRCIRCQRSQISAAAQFMLLESCLLLAGEVLVEGLPPFPKAHVLAARSLLGGFGLRSFYVMSKAAQHMKEQQKQSEAQPLFLKALEASANTEVERVKRLNSKRRDRAQAKNKEALEKENEEKLKQEKLKQLEQEQRERANSALDENNIIIAEAKNKEALEKEKEKSKKENLKKLEQQRRERAGSAPDENNMIIAEAKNKEALEKEKVKSKKENLKKLEENTRRAREKNSGTKQRKLKADEMAVITGLGAAKPEALEGEQKVFNEWLGKKGAYKNKAKKRYRRKENRHKDLLDTGKVRKKKKKLRLRQFTQDVYKTHPKHHHIKLTFDSKGRPSMTVNKATNFTAKPTTKLPRVPRKAVRSTSPTRRPTSSPDGMKRRSTSPDGRMRSTSPMRRRVLRGRLRAAALLHATVTATEHERRKATKRNKSLKLKPMVW